VEEVVACSRAVEASTSIGEDSVVVATNGIGDRSAVTTDFEEVERLSSSFNEERFGAFGGFMRFALLEDRGGGLCHCVFVKGGLAGGDHVGDKNANLVSYVAKVLGGVKF